MGIVCWVYIYIYVCVYIQKNKIIHIHVCYLYIVDWIKENEDLPSLGAKEGIKEWSIF